MKQLLLAVIAALSTAVCDPQPVPAPSPVPSPAPPAPSSPTCAAACDQFRFLGCSEGEPTPEGATCVDVCETAQVSPAPLDLGCIVRASTCAEARKCE